MTTRNQQRPDVATHIKGMQRLHEPLAQEAQVEEVGTGLVPTANKEIALTQALHTGTLFASSARRGSAPLIAHRITWFTGNNKCFTMDGKALPDIKGWGIEQPNFEEEVPTPEDYELMDVMEVLCAQGIAAPVIVQHFDSNGRPRPVPYWSLEHASLFVVCEGIPSKQEMLKDASCRWGIAYGWPQGKKSELHMIAYVKQLMEIGYNYAFIVKFSSYLTDNALACLKAHERVLNIADALRQQMGIDEPLPYYAYALTITASKRSKTAGDRPGETKEIYYPMPVIPFKITEQYLAEMAVSDDQAAVIEDDDRINATVKWSVEKSKRILEGKADGEDDLLGGHPF